MTTNLRDELREHQVATNCSDDLMVGILCDFLQKLDMDADLGDLWQESLMGFVVEELERLPGDTLVPFWRSDTFTDTERGAMVLMMEEELRDSLRDTANDTLDGEDEVSIIGYAADDAEGLAEMLQRVNSKDEEVHITGEFLREHEDGDGYPAMLDFAVRTGLLAADECTITQRGLDFIDRFA